MATSTITVPNRQTLGANTQAMCDAVSDQFAAAKADIEGLTAASLSTDTPAGPGTGDDGAAATASKSDHVHPPVSLSFRIDDAAANTTTAEKVLCTLKAASTISAVKFCADAAVTQSDTDYATITIKQGDGAGGARSTVVAQTSKTTGGANLAAFSAVSLGALANAVVPAGGCVTLTVAKAASGQQLKGVLVLEFS